MKARTIAALVCGATLGLMTLVTPPVLSEESAESAVPNVRVKATGAAAHRRGSGKPTTVVSTFKDSVVIPAGSPWFSPVRFVESCTFDLAVEYDETFKEIMFDGSREIMQIEINDRYTNLASGFTFVDRARYSIRWDMATGLAVHSGTMWQVNVEGAGIEVHDVGQFTQDWSVEPPPLAPIIERHGSFDVNVLPFGTLSYCDWAQGIFP